ncbi:c-type cytochrome [Klebsiella aerogenes]|uniref:c-type cytochrome n=1 Tax=Klebsiella aerogenes TaxID=548 RepID=UPI00379852FC
MMYRGAAIFIMLCCITATHATMPGDAQRGRYLATLADCAACHSVSKTAPYSGGLKIQTPVGAIFSTNITPDKRTGIGNYSYEDFSRAVREGIGKKGKPLYPAMPYPSFSRIEDQDMLDLYTYFMNDVTPVSLENKKTTLPWPLSIRWPLHFWRWFFTETPENLAQQNADPQWQRGAYLVQGPGHCGACHTPRGLALQEKALNESENGWLSGGKVDTWFAPPLTQDKRTGLGEWSSDDIITFLSTGTNKHATAFGPMAEVVTRSTSQFTDADLAAIARYLKSLSTTPSSPQLKPAVSREALTPGASLYADNCSACHQSAGEGYPGIYPALSGNPAVQSHDPSSVISLLLEGGQPPSLRGGADDDVMPDFSSQLSDEQIADILNYIRNSWGNAAAEVNEKQVSDIRKSLKN